MEVVLLYQAVQCFRAYSAVRDGSKKNGAGGGSGVLERYDITDRVEHDKKADDKRGSKAYPSRTSFGQRWEIAEKHGIDTGPLKILGIPISGMMYYVNWVLTNAQLELLAADVSVVDYDYGDRKKHGKGEYDDRPASSEDIRKANQKWLERYGSDKDAGSGISAIDILGGSATAGVGVKLK